MSPCKWKRIQSRNCKRKEAGEAGTGREEDSRPEQSLVEQTNQNVRTPAIFGKRLTARGTEREREGTGSGKERGKEIERDRACRGKRDGATQLPHTGHRRQFA